MNFKKVNSLTYLVLSKLFLNVTSFGFNTQLPETIDDSVQGLYSQLENPPAGFIYTDGNACMILLNEASSEIKNTLTYISGKVNKSNVNTTDFKNCSRRSSIVSIVEAMSSNENETGFTRAFSNPDVSDNNESGNLKRRLSIKISRLRDCLNSDLCPVEQLDEFLNYIAPLKPLLDEQKDANNKSINLLRESIDILNKVSVYMHALDARSNSQVKGYYNSIFQKISQGFNWVEKSSFEKEKNKLTQIQKYVDNMDDKKVKQENLNVGVKLHSLLDSILELLSESDDKENNKCCGLAAIYKKIQNAFISLKNHIKNAKHSASSKDHLHFLGKIWHFVRMIGFSNDVSEDIINTLTSMEPLINMALAFIEGFSNELDENKIDSNFLKAMSRQNNNQSNKVLEQKLKNLKLRLKGIEKILEESS